MAVEVNDGDRAVGLVDTAQQRQGDGVVTAEGDDTRQGFARPGHAVLVGIGVGLAHEDAVVALFNLLDGPFIVVPMGSQRDDLYAAVDIHTKSRGCRHNPGFSDH